MSIIDIPDSPSSGTSEAVADERDEQPWESWELDEFSMLLDSERSVDKLLKAPKDAISSKQKAALRSIAGHFCADEHGPDELGPESQVGSGTRKRRQTQAPSDGARKRARRAPATARPAPPARNPMNPIIRLDTLSLDPVVNRFLQSHGPDAPVFLARAGGQIRATVKDTEAGSDADAFLERYKLTLNLNAQLDTNNQLWCYSMLFYYDLVKQYNPNGSGRVGDLMWEDIVAWFGRVLNNAPICAADLVKNLNKWSVLGKRLHNLSVEFGSGFVFFLGHVLSRNFVANRLTGSGRYFDDAVLKLRELKLADIAAESRANELGQAIRDHLIKPFKALGPA
ncbi:hypothetical protein W97_08398 [Coniosporium apollinis CBS 100218]|uniref:Uncharacterized protein n=1 Tax=Coniosporium apollinis (strain CBS 100218) TaxID=1168221 RepID=R7Z4K2_CONA1|nr:uncharacterized protein W97_08398 [Coniosporium apollinis CBS 100218]EON69085.1 hypothetical protein W97_08398 [Coniosporium apollinis CBS 100218]